MRSVDEKDRLAAVIRPIDVVRELVAKKGVRIDPPTASEVVVALLVSPDSTEDLAAEVRGLNSHGRPMTVVVRSAEVREAIRRARPPA